MRNGLFTCEIVDPWGKVRQVAGGSSKRQETGALSTTIAYNPTPHEDQGVPPKDQEPGGTGASAGIRGREDFASSRPVGEDAGRADDEAIRRPSVAPGSRSLVTGDDREAFGTTGALDIVDVRKIDPEHLVT
jgi:hypothetical protein